MKIAYFDCFSGISGDMTLGAFLDAGLSMAVLKKELAKLGVKGYRLSAAKTERGGLSGTKFDCVVEKRAGHNHMPFARIISILENSGLRPKVKETARRMFERIAAAEAKVHGVKQPGGLVLHELGDIDSIVDITGVAIAIDELEIEEIRASRVMTGRTFVRTRHGKIPVPAPATMELLKGVPVEISETAAELVTPTGAAILSTLCRGYGSFPSMEISKIGYGAGSMKLRDTPNMLRVLIGEAKPSFKSDRVVVIETNIDDMSPQVFEYLFERLFEAGALDVWTEPVQMKKSRPGFKLSVLADPALLEKMSAIIFRETPTIGLRFHEAGRYKLDRKVVNTKTRYGTIPVKVSSGPGGLITASPEYRQCATIAREKGISLKSVQEAARHAVKV